ncbi:MAG: hypothetical protein NTY22_04170, partial [Proteobacteria bacterium]|nr:hypothetical protein [Pseudomonadota bacterium]
MFSNSVNEAAFKDIKAAIEAAKPDRNKIITMVSKAARLERLSLNDLLYLLNDEARLFMDDIKKTAYNITVQRHGKVMRFYAPLYVSNE